MRKLWVLLAFFFLNNYSWGQTNYAIFRDTATLTAADSGKLSLSIDNLNYLRDYEWFGNIPLSYTLLGYQFTPQIKYQLNDRISFKGGIYLRREFGRPGFFTVEPVYTAKYQKKGLTFIMGTLEGALNHRFAEPIYNIERIISQRNEQGLQLKLDKKRFWMDWFIDWRKAIILNDPFREQLNSGISTRTKILDRPQAIIEIPLQALIVHHGGQISSSPDPIESLLNTAAGADFTFPTKNSFLKTVQAAHYFLYYKNLSGFPRQIYNKGNGVLSSLTLKSKWNIDLDLRYWKGHKFYGAVGLPLYNSISEKKEGFGEMERELFFVTFIYNKKLFENVSIDMRLEPYYDIRNRFLEYGYSVFLRFNKDFFLKRIK